MFRVALALVIRSLSVTVMVSLAPLNAGSTVNEELNNAKSAPTLHVKRGGGGPLVETEVPAMVQARLCAKLVPVTVTVLPRCAGFGDNVIFGTTVKIAWAESPVLPRRVIATFD